MSEKESVEVSVHSDDAQEAMNVDETNEESSKETELVKRIQELRRKYQEEVGVGTEVQRGRKRTARERDRTARERDHDKDKDVDHEDEPHAKHKKRPKKNGFHHDEKQSGLDQSKKDASVAEDCDERVYINGTDIAVLATRIIDAQGGAAHFETIAELVCRALGVPENATNRNSEDSAASGAKDCSSSSSSTSCAMMAETLSDDKNVSTPVLTREFVRGVLSHVLISNRTFYKSMRRAESDVWMLSALSLGFASDESEEDDVVPRTFDPPRLAGRASLDSEGLAADLRYDSLAGAILRVLEEQRDRGWNKDGAVHERDVADVIVARWYRPSPSMTDEHVREAVALTLRTSVFFRQSRASPNFWQMSPICAKLPARWRCGETVSSMYARAAATDCQTQAMPLAASAASQSSSSTGASRGNSDMSCFYCHAKIPGRGPNARWKRGAKPNTAVCLACHFSRPKKHVCPVCGKVYKELATVENNRSPAMASLSANTAAAVAAAAAATAAASSSRMDNDDEVTSEDEWIQCDLCKRWVMYSCDSTIGDLSLYTDKRNATPYYCPICRKSATTTVLTANAENEGGEGAENNGTAGDSTADEKSVLKRKREEDMFVESILSGMSERFDRLFACAARLPQYTSEENVPVLEATILKRTEKAIRRAFRDRNKRIDKSASDCAKERATIEQEFLQQFRDHLDRMYARNRGSNNRTNGNGDNL